MTVSQLIDELLKFDQGAEVVVWGLYGASDTELQLFERSTSPETCSHPGCEHTHEKVFLDIKTSICTG